MEGLPRSCYMRPLTHLDSEPSGLIRVSESTLCAFMECLSGRPPSLVHGALSFHSEVCGAAAQGRMKGCTSYTQEEPRVCWNFRERPGLCCSLFFRVGASILPPARSSLHILSTCFCLHHISSNFLLAWKKKLCIALIRLS